MGRSYLLPKAQYRFARPSRIQYELDQKDPKEGLNEDASLKTIIVPLDGSRRAERILPHAAHPAQGLDIPVTLVRVTDPLEQYRNLEGYHSLDGATKSQGSLFEDMAMDSDEEALECRGGLFLAQPLHPRSLRLAVG